MDALGTLIREFAERGIVPTARKPEITVERMRVAPPLERVQADVRVARDWLSEMRAVWEKSDEDQRMSLSRKIRTQEAVTARLEEMLEVVQFREDLQYERAQAFGCEPWCLGAGWLRDSELVPSGLGDGQVVARPMARYCSCPAGVAAKQKHEGEAAGLRRKQMELRVKRFFGDAQIPKEYANSTLENLPNRMLAKRCRQWLDQVDDPNGKPWAYINGGFGSTKTSASCAMMKEWIEQKGGARFVTVPDLLEEIRATYGNERLDPEEREKVKTTSQVLQMYATVPLLVLDDMGAENLTERNAAWVEEQLYKLLNARHNGRLPTIISSNLPLAKVAKQIGDRVWNRILGMAEPIYAGEKNYRAE